MGDNVIVSESALHRILTQSGLASFVVDHLIIGLPVCTIRDNINYYSLASPYLLTSLGSRLMERLIEDMSFEPNELYRGECSNNTVSTYQPNIPSSSNSLHSMVKSGMIFIMDGNTFMKLDR